MRKKFRIVVVVATILNEYLNQHAVFINLSPFYFSLSKRPAVIWNFEE